MAQPSQGSGPGGARQGYFVIADISGYTGYLANNELEHAQGILSEFTNLIMAELSSPFQFVELEGDAVFVYAPDAAVEDAERLIEIVERVYAAFRLLQEQMVTNTTCTCQACRAIKDLDLKCVGHHGQYLPQDTPKGMQLVGPDVILVHRLLKNSVIERTGVPAYGLFTDAFIAKATLGESGLGCPVHVETYEDLGRVSGRVVDLAAAVARYTGAKRIYVSSEDADFELVTELPLTAREAWAYHIDASRRHTWQSDTVGVENGPAADGRFGIGAPSYCDHGGYRLNHRVVDWRPCDYFTMDSVGAGRSPAKPPPSLATFEMEDLGDGRCRASMRLRTQSRSLPTRLLMTLASPLIRRQWRAHYERLKDLVRQDQARIAQG